MTQIMSGQDLIDAGMSQGKWFRSALDEANKVLSQGGSAADALEAARAFQPGPTIALRKENDIEIYSNIRAENAFE